MPSTQIHLPDRSSAAVPNALPQLLRLPTGLALLELQGDINFPEPDEDDDAGMTTIGKLVFPDVTGSEGADIKELKKVWLYVGKNQRLTGEVKALPKPLGVLRKRRTEDGTVVMSGGTEELEIVDVIKYKIHFNKRPEPVS